MSAEPRAQRGPHSGRPEGDEPAPSWLARFRRVLAAQIDAALSLDHLSQVHQGAVRAGEPEAVLDVLAQRDAVIERLRAGGAELEPFVTLREGASASPMEALQASEQAAVRADLARLSLILERVAQRDQDALAALGARRAALADELGALAAGRGVPRAYAPVTSGAPAPTYQDRQA